MHNNTVAPPEQLHHDLIPTHLVSVQHYPCVRFPFLVFHH